MTDQAVSVREGRIYWRNVFLRTEDAERLLAIFRADPEPYARDFAEQLEAGLAQIQPMEHAA